MSKIAIISQPDQGVLIDVGGCSTMQEAIEHLSSTLQVSSQFWKGLNVSLNLGDLSLTPVQVNQILALAKGVGVFPTEVYAEDARTKASLAEHSIKLGDGSPMMLPRVSKEKQPAMSIVYETQDTIDFADGLAQTKAVNESEIKEVLKEEQPETIVLEEAPEEAPVQASKETPALPVVPVVLYLKQTIRSGQAISHKGNLVIVGDVNPGGEVIAEGDIVVWGSLRGMAHAGVGGNTNAEIRALKLEPIQIRIAHLIARSPDRVRPAFTMPKTLCPETARIIEGKIRISRSQIE